MPRGVYRERLPFRCDQQVLRLQAPAYCIGYWQNPGYFAEERETILSVLSDSEPGRVSLNRDFISRVAVYVGLPIISLLGAQFPEVAQQLFSWTSSFFGTH